MTANKNNNLDATDWKILAELQRDARSSYKEIGEAVGMTRPAVRERMLRMEESGVVTGYRAEIDTDALGRALHVMISFKFNSDQKYDKKPNDILIPILRSSSDVIHFWEIYGELDFLIEAAFVGQIPIIIRNTPNVLRGYGFVRSHLIAMSTKGAVQAPD